MALSRIAGFFRDSGSLSKNSLFFFASNSGTLALNLAAAVVISRVLGPAGKGGLSLIQVAAALAVFVASLGIHQSAVFLLGQNKERSRSIVSNTVFFVVAVGSVLGIAAWLLRDNIARWLSLSDWAAVLGLASLLYPLMLAQSVFSGLLMGQKRFMARNIASLLQGILQLVAVIVLVGFLHLGLTGGVLALVLPLLAVALYSYSRATEHAKPAVSQTDWKLFKRSVTYGLKSQAGNVLQMFNYRFDMFVVNYFIGVANVGIYSVAAAIGDTLWHVPTAVGNVLFPMVSGDSKRYDAAYVCAVCRQTLILCVIGALGLLACGWALIPMVFGEAFRGAVIPLMVRLPGTVAVAVHKVLIFALMGSGHPQYMSYTGAITLVFTILFDVLLIPPLGIMGAALASTMAYTICACATATWYTRIHSIPWHMVVVPRKSDFANLWCYAVRTLKRIPLGR